MTSETPDTSKADAALEPAALETVQAMRAAREEWRRQQALEAFAQSTYPTTPPDSGV